ncbi:3-alpha--hydroxysteroid dehydrogenase [Lentithecium fluviatile CBS 122367]|uniref:3-alpha--hydroxysteroid dehydrogenase n=1 Tax=Lentithecium fluviatile CBS 122367 TaxID=1168545 RepID=A0A6G1IMM7_9PLEO|nr:3-alpha--hydroxysteroid dehydrogenase [Lentithecium fluviatile CBS 122367]
MSIKDNVICITGAASGIAFATAHHFASKGAILSLADIQEKPLNDLAEELQKRGTRILATVVDVSNRASVESWIAKTVGKFGKLDGAANLAGVIGKQHNLAGIADIDDDDWDFVQSVNVKGMLNCLRAQVPNMKDGGAIVNAASISGLVGSKNNVAYCASKHAVVGMTRALAKELGEKNIRVNCFCPGPINTPMLRQSAALRGSTLDYSFLALKRAADQTEVPPLLEFLISDAASFITGVAMPIDGGWYC